ncbi:septal ring lytic transglycosylase RlpA family protein [Candidatus Gromoviella agglomerans]|uniref:septal ring lytic transglycosylase RlpA family protein n=1 Tax=Candidatus Gromoviella agglomerans TaxID=2806609 RepID=UPI001E4ED19C|nr:septal ring lytic transglycosylase RlpA family protein [Candidatus Gromoviella agglomerans]
MLRMLVIVMVIFMLDSSARTNSVSNQKYAKVKKSRDNEKNQDNKNDFHYLLYRSIPKFKYAPYIINQMRFIPQNHFKYAKIGSASYYSNECRGLPTAIGDIFDPMEITAAHRTLPIPCFVRVTNLQNGRSLIVLVNDRGPYIKGRIIDLSKRCAEILGYVRKGHVMVKVECLPAMSVALGKIFALVRSNDKYAIALYKKIRKLGVKDLGD